MRPVEPTLEDEKTLFRCDICLQDTNAVHDIVLFGEWLVHNDLRVHYFCLLLSTNLQQRGKGDRSGLLGFLIPDIRREIHAASKRLCYYCRQPNATIKCHKCKVVFHMVCGRRFHCLHQFTGKYRSFCGRCAPLTEFQQNVEPSKGLGVCYICYRPMGSYIPVKFIYAECCKTGFVHRFCLQKYALIAGYYLKCIWCRSSAFRDHVRSLGVYVPDRDAQWEREDGAFRELHRGHERCDMEPCNCPRGRTYFAGTLKWSLILCELCGSVGAHNSGCVPGLGVKHPPAKIFRCSTCEQTMVKLKKKKKAKCSVVEVDDKSLVPCEVKLDSDQDMDSATNNPRSLQVTELPAIKGPEADTDESMDFPVEAAWTHVWADVYINEPQGSLDLSTDESADVPLVESSELATQPQPQPQLQVSLDLPTDVSADVPLVESSELPTEPHPQPQLQVSLDLPTDVSADVPLVESSELPTEPHPQPKPKPKPKVSTSEHAAINEVLFDMFTVMFRNRIREGKKEKQTSTQTEEPPSCSLAKTTTEDHDMIDPSSSSDDVIATTYTFELFRYDRATIDLGLPPDISTVKVNLNSPRWRGMTLDQIQSNTQLLRKEDIVSTTDDRGLFSRIDKIIEEAS